MKITSWLMLRDEGNEWNVRMPRGLCRECRECREWSEARAEWQIMDTQLCDDDHNMTMFILYLLWCCTICTTYILPPSHIRFLSWGSLNTTSLPTRGEINEWWDELHNQHSTQPQYSTSFRWQDVSGEGETCWMFPSWYQSRATSALMTFSIFPLSESLSSLSTQEPRPVSDCQCWRNCCDSCCYPSNRMSGPSCESECCDDCYWMCYSCCYTSKSSNRPR